MKKVTLILILMLAITGFSRSQQMIEDFEHIPINLMLGGEDDNSEMTVVPNPDQGDANPSHYVLRFDRSMNGVPWGGFWSSLPQTIDMTEKKYVHAMVWKPRISPVKFKVEGGPGGTFELESVEPQTLTGEWETLTFHFPDADGEYPIVAFLPDFEDPLTLTEDIVIYLDHIVLSDSETPGEGNEVVIEDFESIAMNAMLGGDDDNSEFSVIYNPDSSEVNPSNRVGQYYRSQNGVPWGGFFSALDEPMDFTEHKYVYVKVWKPRISPVKIKIEGNGDPVELESMFPQTKTNEWEELVFDFSDVTGEWGTIVLMPDFIDPVGLDQDIVIYFDDIKLGDAPETGQADVDFVWSDFETDGLTNVEGFRDPLNDQTTAADMPGEGVDGGTAVKLDYEVSEENPLTGYRMWAFPHADVSAYNYLVLHIKADQNISQAKLGMYDTTGIDPGDNGISYTNFDISTEWQEVVIPLENFEAAEGVADLPDMTVLQLIALYFDFEEVDVTTTTVYIDLVGFNEDSDVSVRETDQLDMRVNLYPNPASNLVNVEAPENSHITLIDIAGNVVAQKFASSTNTQINVVDFSAGIYFVQIVNNKKVHTSKLVIR